MNIKEFQVGQKAYIVNIHKGSNKPPCAYQTRVVKVGREYVTTNYYGKRFRSSSITYGLIETLGA